MFSSLPFSADDGVLEILTHSHDFLSRAVSVSHHYLRKREKKEIHITVMNREDTARNTKDSLTSSVTILRTYTSTSKRERKERKNNTRIIVILR